MTTDREREEILLCLLEKTGLALDPVSVATTYNTPVQEWRETFQRLDRKGLVEPRGDNLFKLTKKGEEMAKPRGGGDIPFPVGVAALRLVG